MPERLTPPTIRVLMKQGMTREAAEEAVAGVMRGLKERAEGLRKPLSQVKKELGL